MYVSLTLQSVTSPPIQKEPLGLHAGPTQFGTRQRSVLSSKQQGIFPTPPIQRNNSVLLQSGTSPFVQKLPLLVQDGIIQFGVLVPRVTGSTQTGISIDWPMH